MVTLNGFVTVLSVVSFFTGASSAAYVNPSELVKITKEFKTAGIVPDVLPSFKPSALAYLTFAYGNGTSETVTPGLRIGRDGKATVTLPIGN